MTEARSLPKPTCISDVRAWLVDVVDADRLDKLLDFKKQKDKPLVLVKPKRWLGRETFKALARKVKEMDGRYVQRERLFEVPIVPEGEAPAEKSAPPVATSEEIVEGVIERVETLADRNWIRVYVANVSKPLAIRPDKATPGLKPGNRIRAEIGVGESWLFIRRFDIMKEERPAAPKVPEGPQPYTRLGYYPEFPIDKILSSKFSFRLNIGEGIQDLMAEIHAAGRIIEPLICRPHRKLTYVEVGPGERRLLAARNLGLKAVPVIVYNFTDQEFDRIRLLENIARRDLTDYEMARVLDYIL